jgi:hypothetical protein
MVKAIDRLLEDARKRVKKKPHPHEGFRRQFPQDRSEQRR